MSAPALELDLVGLGRNSAAKKRLQEIVDGKRALVNAAGKPAARTSAAVATERTPVFTDTALEGL